MRFATPFLLALATLASAAAFAPSMARAQEMCTSCTPTSSCDETCLRCRPPFNVDGTCSNTVESTCGATGGTTRGCMRSGCTSSFQEQSRVNRGTYGVGYVVYCEHHRVDFVTRTDVNQCNTNSSFWTSTSCENTMDGYKFGTSTPDCCDGTPGFTCNHFHSC